MNQIPETTTPTNPICKKGKVSKMALVTFISGGLTFTLPLLFIFMEINFTFCTITALISMVVAIVSAVVSSEIIGSNTPPVRGRGIVIAGVVLCILGIGMVIFSFIVALAMAGVNAR
jgi:hypothetical protein